MWIFLQQEMRTVHTQRWCSTKLTLGTQFRLIKAHQLSLAKHQEEEQKTEEMVAADVIEPSNSPWAAPAVLEKKMTKAGAPLWITKRGLISPSPYQ